MSSAILDYLPLLQAAAQQHRIRWDQPPEDLVRQLDLTGLRELEWLDLPWWGPLEMILRDPAVHDIYVNGPDRPVLVGRSGVVMSTDLVLSEHWVRWLQQRLLAFQNGAPESWQPTINDLERLERRAVRVDPLQRLEAQPLFSGVTHSQHGIRRLRFALTTPAMTPDGPTITLRVLPQTWATLDQLVADGMLPKPVAQLLQRALQAGVTILIAGGTGSGKTTITAALKEAMGLARSVVVQDVPELPTGGAMNDVGYVVPDGDAAAFLRCVRHALRQQPERIIIGEGRGSELLAMLEGAATGHPGMTTLHASSAAEALLRIETCAAMAPEATPEMVRATLSGLSILVVVVQRIQQQRRVVEVAELRRGSSPRPGDPYELGIAWALQAGTLQRTADPLRARWAQEIVV